MDLRSCLAALDQASPGGWSIATADPIDGEVCGLSGRHYNVELNMDGHPDACGATVEDAIEAVLEMVRGDKES